MIRGFFRLKLKKKGILVNDAMIKMISEEIVMSKEEMEEAKIKYPNNDDEVSTVEEFKVLEEHEEEEANKLILEKSNSFPAPQPIFFIELTKYEETLTKENCDVFSANESKEPKEVNESQQTSWKQ